MNKEMPLINQNIKRIIDDDFNGNVSKFSQFLGLKSCAKINRLFNIDKRNNKYPDVSGEILILVSKKCNIPIDSLVNDKQEKKVVNNIEINSNKINGEKNIIGNNNSQTTTADGYIEIIKRQQEQIDNLIKLLNKK